ncbi:conjugal transfer protein TraS [Edwardsiella tarda]|uniref:Conjugal transfer protein TraS n=1 Tax=Edwardsiella tarda TaxID=636 RepID=A0A2A7U8A7_EDWTA|nr:conjugal transfer protein TraS [Edwardsiella tarda]PEH74473.1 conjugal transfer protein TraS [Edwardsiella tarda]
MITHEKIKNETEELKAILSNGKMEIPTMWECMWPGLLFVAWLILCGIISYAVSDYTSQMVLLMYIGGGGIIGFMILMSSSNARGLFLSVPYEFRKKSLVYNFVGFKIKCYAVSAFVLLFFMAVVCGVFNFSWFVFLIVFTILFISVMMIDFSRYQLAAFSNVISAFKESKNS